VIIRIRSKHTVLAERAALPAQIKRGREIACAAFRARSLGRQRIYHKLGPAAQADLRRIIADAPMQSFMDWVVSVVLYAVIVEVVRIPIGP